VLQTALNVSGHTVTGWGNQDILISSFKCDGTYRWSKDIGGTDNDIPIAIKIDTLGGVYITGQIYLNSSIGHFSTDTTVPLTNRSVILIKYDTAGSYKWLRFPQSDTIGLSSVENTALYDMDVDEGGNSYILCQLAPGAYAGGAYIVTTQGFFIFKYDKNGTFISGSTIQISDPDLLSLMRMKKNFQNGKYYITGTVNGGTLSFGGLPITHALFVGCFDNSGTFLWQKQDVLFGGGFVRPNIDAIGNVYLAAGSEYGDTFNTYVNTDAYVGVGAPFVTKMDSNGTFIWAKSATASDVSGASASTNATSTSVLNGSEIDIAGQYPGELKWQGYADSLNLPTGSGYHIFITRLDASTGTILGLDSLASTTGEDNHAIAMTSDNFGNFYVGGDFASSITVNGTTLNSIGGGSDFFIAKYGTANCECVLPTASFTHTGATTVTFTYTGTTVYDSVRWKFGDGGTSTVLSPVHAYTAAGTYTACIIVYGSCGNDTACQSITIATTGIAGTAAVVSNISIYPNPTTEELNITGVTTTTAYRIYNITGSVMKQGMLNAGTNIIPMSNYAPGIYVLDMTGEDGTPIIMRIVKQ
jgi:PKD repeat protein